MTDVNKELFCRLYVTGPENLDALKTALARCLTETREEAEVHGRECDVDFFNSADYNRNKLKSDPNDFVFFPYNVEVYQKPEVTYQDYVKKVSELLEAAWNEGWACVAACNFEDELPRNGGWRDGKLQ